MKIFLISFLSLIPITVYGQQPEISEDPKSLPKLFKNSIELEIFGHGLFYSINYERLIINRERYKTLGQVGIAYYPESTGLISMWIPISVNQLISFDKHHVEFGIGQVIHNDKFLGKSDYETFGSFKIGYRLYKLNERFLFKIAFTPFIEYWPKFKGQIYSDYKIYLYPSGGITFGYNF